MAKKKHGKKQSNRSPQRWLAMSLYPIILAVLFFGVALGGWAAEAVKSEPNKTHDYTERDADDLLKKFGISDMEDITDVEEADLEDMLGVLGLDISLKDIEKGKISEEDLQKLGLDGTDPENITLEAITERVNELISEEIATNDANDSTVEEEDQTSEEMSEDQEDSGDEEDADDTETDDESVDESEEDMSLYYYYSICSETEKTLYNEMLNIFSGMKTFTKISATDKDEINKIYNYLMADHPEIFYVSGYTWTENDGTYAFTGQYEYTEAEMLTNKALNEAAAKQIADGTPSGLTEYETIKYFYTYLVENTTYELNCQWNQEISSVFINHNSVCAGYARAMQYLLQLKGIQTLYVTGDTPGGPHAWNVVLVDGKYYQLDVCWADPNNATVPNPDYAYLCIPTSRISSTHTVDESTNPIPDCVSMDANYYVQEGYYLESFDTDRIAEIFENSKIDNRGIVYIMAADASTYAALKNYVIDQNYILDLYYGENTQGNLRYQYNDDLYTMSVYEKLD